MAEHDQGHVAGHDEGRESHAMLIRSLDEGPKQDDCTSEQQGLADQPEETQPSPTVARDDLPQHEGGHDRGVRGNRPENHNLAAFTPPEPTSLQGSAPGLFSISTIDSESAIQQRRSRRSDL
ncbi:hypothetical protein D3C87_1857370 [compost metagenome]